MSRSRVIDLTGVPEEESTATLSAFCLHSTYTPSQANSSRARRLTKLRIISGLCPSCHGYIIDVIKLNNLGEKNVARKNEYVVRGYWARRAKRPLTSDFPNYRTWIMSIDAVVHHDDWVQTQEYWHKKLREKIIEFSPAEISMSHKKWDFRRPDGTLPSHMATDIAVAGVGRIVKHTMALDTRNKVFWDEAPWSDVPPNELPPIIAPVAQDVSKWIQQQEARQRETQERNRREQEREMEQREMQERGRRDQCPQNQQQEQRRSLRLRKKREVSPWLLENQCKTREWILREAAGLVDPEGQKRAAEGMARRAAEKKAKEEAASKAKEDEDKVDKKDPKGKGKAKQQ